MLHEVKVQYKTRNDDGNEVTKKDWYIVDNCNLFCEVEHKVFKNFNYDTIKDFDVTDIKRSRIKEVANTRSSDNEKMFMAEVKDTFTTDDGVEKEIKYKVVFFSTDIDKALSFIIEYMEQGYDMSLIGLKKTKYVDLLQ